MMKRLWAALGAASLLLASTGARAANPYYAPGSNDAVPRVHDDNNASYSKSGDWLAANTTGPLPLPAGIASGQTRGTAWSCSNGANGTATLAYADGSQGEQFMSLAGDTGHAYASVVAGVVGCKIQAIY